MIIDYKIVYGDAVMPVTFEAEVKSMMGDGWQPLGGICKDAGTLAQAMVRYS